MYAFVIGSLPVITCTSKDQVSSLVKALLTAPQLMEYYLCLLIAFAVVSVFSWRTKFRSFLLMGKTRELHRFLVSIGGSLLMAFRAALGAMMGFLLAWCYHDLEEMSSEGVVAVLRYAGITLMVCVVLAWADEVLRDLRAVNRYT